MALLAHRTGCAAPEARASSPSARRGRARPRPPSHGSGTGRALLDAALAEVSQPIAIYDDRRRLVFCNAAAVALLDLPERLTRPGTPYRETLLHQQRRGAITEAEVAQRDRSIKSVPHMRHEYCDTDGTVVQVRRDAISGGGFIVLYNDVTEQRRAERTLQENEQRYYAVVEAQTDLIIRFGADRRITFANGAYRRLLGGPHGQSFDTDVLDVVHPDDRKAVGRFFSRSHGRRPMRTIEHRIVVPSSGDIRTIQRTDRVIQSGDGQPPEFQSVMRDVTEAKAVQEYLQRANKLSTLGQIVAGITHELNQPLNAAALATQNALLDLECSDVVDPDYIRSKLESLAKSLAAMGHTVNHLRTFLRPQPTSGSGADPCDAVRRTVELLSNQFALDSIDVQLDLPNRCPPVSGLGTDLETVLVNLLVNARDAIMHAREEISAEPHGRISVSVVVRPRRKRVCICVSDDGGGIAAEVMRKMFDPFFTTKEVGMGIGLGLSIVHATIENLGGQLDVQNRVGGAEFSVILPTARAS